MADILCDCRAAALIITTLLVSPANGADPSTAPANDTSIAISALAGASLRGSKFRHIGLFDSALQSALSKCGKNASVPSLSAGRLDASTVAAIKTLQRCPGFEGIDDPNGDVTPRLWSKLLPTVPMPDAFGRLFIVTLTLENTDYDRFEWNYTAADPTAWGTWGPFGATIGQEAEIQKILTAAEEADATSVKTAFVGAAAAIPAYILLPASKSRGARCAKPATGPKDDYDLFRKIATLRGETAGEALRVAFCDDRRHEIWVEAFRRLGAEGVVRKAYDRYYFADPGKVARYIRTTREAYAASNASATELDLAMGVDGATQLSSRANTAALASAVKQAGTQAVERRGAISEALPTSARNRKDRCGRDAVFFIGSLNKLPPRQTCADRTWDLQKAWKARAGFEATLLGLRDLPSPDLTPTWNYDFDSH